MPTKTYAKTYAAPARRNVIAIGAFQRSGAGVHTGVVRNGPTVDEWDYRFETEQDESVETEEADFDEKS